MYSYTNGSLLTALQTLYLHIILLYTVIKHDLPGILMSSLEKQQCHKNLYSPMSKGLVSFARRREKLQVSQIIQPTSKMIT